MWYLHKTCIYFSFYALAIWSHWLIVLLVSIIFGDIFMEEIQLVFGVKVYNDEVQLYFVLHFHSFHLDQVKAKLNTICCDSAHKTKVLWGQNKTHWWSWIIVLLVFPKIYLLAVALLAISETDCSFFLCQIRHRCSTDWLRKLGASAFGDCLVRFIGVVLTHLDFCAFNYLFCMLHLVLIIPSWFVGFMIQTISMHITLILVFECNMFKANGNYLYYNSLN